MLDRIEKGISIKEKPANSVEEYDKINDEYQKWDSFNLELLNALFTTDKFAHEYRMAISVGVMFLGVRPLYQKISDFQKDINGKILKLESIIERLELIPENLPSNSGQVTQTLPKTRSISNKIFVVHGHDMAACDGVARFLEKLSLDAVILQEQPNGGNTIIEKFEANSNVDFAVVLLTPDDLGSAVTAQDTPRLRARQNVIFELGFFCGRLGRKHVAALTKGDIEIPSDYNGIAYISMDPAEAWKLRLAIEFKAAGIAVDLNDLC